MTNILDICEEVHIRHHGLISAWSPLLGRPFSSVKNMGYFLRSAEDLCSYYAYDALATAIEYSDYQLLSSPEVQAGVTVMAQQIAWCIPKQLAAALQTATVAAQYQPELLSNDILELMLTGLSQLLEQTVINPDDTVKSASEKGKIRKESVVLAQKLYQTGLVGERPEILDRWFEVLHDNNEFNEIRNAR